MSSTSVKHKRSLRGLLSHSRDMAVPFSNTKLRVPKGFQNLLEGLARETLRNQPENIYAYAAAYFENLLKIREGKNEVSRLILLK